MRTRITLRHLCGSGFTLASSSSGPLLRGETLTCDLSQYHRLEGLEAKTEKDSLIVTADGEPGQKLSARFGTKGGVPVIRELVIQARDGQRKVLAQDLEPEFGVTTGIRRTNHGLPEENRWDVFWDVPLNHANEVRRFRASCRADRCTAKTDGARL